GFWGEQDHSSVGLDWLERLLAHARRSEPSTALVRVLYWAAQLAIEQSDLEGAEAHATDALALARAIGDRRSLADALHVLHLVRYRQGNQQAARALLEECVSVWRKLRDEWGLAMSQPLRGELAVAR